MKYFDFLNQYYYADVDSDMNISSNFTNNFSRKVMYKSLLPVITFSCLLLKLFFPPQKLSFKWTFRMSKDDVGS